MIKHILSLSLVALLSLAMPVVASASSAVEIVEMADAPAIDITINQNVLRVTGAAGEVMSIYNVTGVKVMSVKVDGTDKSYSLSLPKGCYIVKVGKVVRKISLK